MARPLRIDYPGAFLDRGRTRAMGYRVPIARLAAAQAALKNGKKKRAVSDTR